jgi:thioredoxin reductase (NADPH)
VIQTDALIIGAGPVGLFQVFELGLLDIRAHVIDVLDHVGGQCIELYADKPIYDIPGIPRCTGRELIDRLSTQARPFDPSFHLGQQITQVKREDDGRLQVTSSHGTTWLTRTLFIATGVGAFVARTLAVPALDIWQDRQVFHATRMDHDLAGSHLVIVGSDAHAVQTALAVSQRPASQKAARVTLLHRRQTLDIEDDLLQTWQTAVATGTVHFQVGQIVDTQASPACMTHVQVATPQGDTLALACDELWVLLGLSPKMGPLSEWGPALDRKQVVVDTERFATSEPGIYAVGDCNTYAGKRKLILSGFHEATLAAFAAAAQLNPGQKIPLQYTTASPRLHQLLGVR